MAFSTAAPLRPLRPPNPSLSASLLPLFLATSLPHTVWLLVAATLAHTIPGTNAYSWNFASRPRQCGNFTINLTGNDGTPPFRALVIPFGASPLPNNIEARRITEQVFVTGSERTGSFQLKYPANSQFVAVVSTTYGPWLLLFGSLLVVVVVDFFGFCFL